MTPALLLYNAARSLILKAFGVLCTMCQTVFSFKRALDFQEYCDKCDLEVNSCFSAHLVRGLVCPDVYQHKTLFTLLQEYLNGKALGSGACIGHQH